MTDEEYSQLELLDPAQRALRIAADQAQKILARHSLQIFCARMNPDFVAYRHTLKIIEALEALERGDINRMILAMPTQNGKSFLSSENFPAWYLGRHPKNSVAIASYGQDRANEASRRTRQILLETAWPFDGISVNSSSSAVDLWTLNTGGQMKAAGVASALGGFGAHLLVLDDPHKDLAEADSTTISDKTWEWFRQVFMRRQRRDVRVLIPTTRWNTYDVVGRILDSKGASDWYVLELPGIAVENDVLGRVSGEVLWPEGPALPDPEKGEISPRGFLAMVQQRPSKDNGLYFKREWMGNRYPVGGLPTMSKTTISVDGAWKEGVGNSRSAFAFWGATAADYYLIDWWAGQPEYVDLKRKVVDFFEHHNARELAVEDAASGSALISELRRTTRIPIVAVKAVGTKEARAETATPLFYAGKVVLPDGDPRLDEWIEEHLRFPDKPNDLVDTTSIALQRLAGGPAPLSWGKLSGSRPGFTR